MKTPTIKQLRQQGFKIRVHHFRPLKGRVTPVAVSDFRNVDTKENLFSNYGGRTEIEVTTPDGLKTVKGVSNVYYTDTYNRKLGNEIALGRALKELK